MIVLVMTVFDTKLTLLSSEHCNQDGLWETVIIIDLHLRWKRPMGWPDCFLSTSSCLPSTTICKKIDISSHFAFVILFALGHGFSNSVFIETFWRHFQAVGRLGKQLKKLNTKFFPHGTIKKQAVPKSIIHLLYGYFQLFLRSGLPFL